MSTNPRREPFGQQSSPEPAQPEPKSNGDKEDEGTPMYVTDNPSVYGEPPKEKDDKE